MKKLRATKILLISLIVLKGIHLLAADRSLQVSQKHMLSNAVGVQITQRGMKYFDNRLSSILGNLGVKLDEGYFPALSHSFDKPIKIEDYRDSNPEVVALYQQVRDLLTKWLVGFSLNDHRPKIEIGESGYIAQFNRFALVTDEDLMKSLGKREGAVLAIELDIKKITLATESVKAWDINNEHLGKAGLTDVSLNAGDEKSPLKIRLPFYIRANASGGLDFEALKIRHNLDSVPLELKYKDLIVPTFSVEMNGKKYQLNTEALDKLLQDKSSFILEQIRANIGDFAAKTLPEYLNKKAKEYLSGSLEQVQNMTPPGKDKGDKRPDFIWGLRLQNINLKQSLNISLGAYVEDPINSNSTPVAAHKSRGLPSFTLLQQKDYDIGLSIDRSLINRVLQLSFERKSFENIRQSDGTILKLVAPPSIDYIKAPSFLKAGVQETIVKLRVAVENKPNSMFLKNTIIVEFDVFAKVRPVKNDKGMQLTLQAIDVDSMFLDDKYISLAGALFKGKVREGIKDQLREKSQKWQKNEEVIPGSLPLPPEILGIKLNINRVNMDPNGHLMMYLDYATNGKK